jgi:hypothetical protein
VREAGWNLKYYITIYYKNLFGASEKGNFSMDKSRTDDIPQVSMEENVLLTSEISEEKVRMAIFQMELNKAPGSMVSQASSTRSFRRLLNWTFWIFSAVFMLNN